MPSVAASAWSSCSERSLLGRIAREPKIETPRVFTGEIVLEGLDAARETLGVGVVLKVGAERTEQDPRIAGGPDGRGETPGHRAGARAEVVRDFEPLAVDGLSVGAARVLADIEGETVRASVARGSGRVLMRHLQPTPWVERGEGVQLEVQVPVLCARSDREGCAVDRIDSAMKEGLIGAVEVFTEKTGLCRGGHVWLSVADVELGGEVAANRQGRGALGRDAALPDRASEDADVIGARPPPVVGGALIGVLCLAAGGAVGFFFQAASAVRHNRRHADHGIRRARTEQSCDPKTGGERFHRWGSTAPAQEFSRRSV